MSYTIFKKGALWHYRFQVAGKRVQKTTRQRKSGRADELAKEAYDAAVARANGGEPVPTLSELGAAWLAVHQPVVSPAHYRSVETFLRLHTYELGAKRIDDITTEDVELSRNEHLREHSEATVNHWLRVIKLLSMWAVDRKIMTKRPWKVPMIKEQKRPRIMLPIDVALAWFKAIDQATARSPGAGTAIRLMFGLGLREREAAGARWEWFDWQRGTYTPGKTKGREAQPLPMPGWLIDHLEPKRKIDGLVAPRNDGTPYPAGFARAPMRTANAACATRGITPHRLRGTFATLLSETGVPIQTIQKMMRHKKHSTTMAYLEVNMDIAVDAQNKIGGIIGFERRESGADLRIAPSSDGIS